MSQTAYYIVTHKGQTLGRHHLVYPSYVPSGVAKSLLRRWYGSYPEAVLERDSDQTSTQTGNYTPRERYKWQRQARESFRKLLRSASKAELIEILNQVDPS